MSLSAPHATHTRFERRSEGQSARRFAPLGRALDTRLASALSGPDLARARLGTVPTDHDFLALHTAYRSHDGLARAHELGRAWAADGAAHDGQIAQLIETGEAFGFHWHDSLWLPRFQFDRPRHGMREPVQRALAELDPGLDGWELACWFVEPNVWLDGDAPADRLANALPQVLEAARADRFVRCG
jgi:hypothetical protein